MLHLIDFNGSVCLLNCHMGLMVNEMLIKIVFGNTIALRKLSLLMMPLMTIIMIMME